MTASGDNSVVKFVSKIVWRVKGRAAADCGRSQQGGYGAVASPLTDQTMLDKSYVIGLQPKSCLEQAQAVPPKYASGV